MSGKAYRHPSSVFQTSYTVEWVADRQCYVAKSIAFPHLEARGAFPFTALITLECLIIDDYEEKRKISEAVNNGG